MIRCVVVAFLAGAVAVSAAQTPQFEAAVLKRNVSGDSGQDVDQQGNQYRAHNVTLRTLILNAYRPRATEIIGAPAWLAADRYDLLATMPPGATPEDRAAMLRALLLERLRLSAHLEERDGDVYFLTLARSDRRLGSSIRLSPRDCAAAAAATQAGRPAPEMARAENGAPPCGLRTTAGEMLAGGLTMDSLARNLSSRAGRIVIDRTGLDGYYELTLHYAEPARNGAPPPADDLPSFFTALQEQLGLKLEPGRAPLSTLVIDHVDRATVD
jgi:uncharacterized protein (TIGR03435 family)